MLQRLLFPLGALFAWAGVLPWLLFALRLPAVERVYGVLAYRAFLHPLAELEGFVACFAMGLLFALAEPPPARWEVLAAVIAPLAMAAAGFAGRWELGQLAMVALAAIALRRATSRTAMLWIAFGILLGIAGAGMARFDPERARDLALQGMFSAVAIGAARMLRGDRDRRPWLHALLAAIFAASFWIGRPHLGFAVRALCAIAVARPLRPDWDFGPENLRRGLAHAALWLLAFGNAWAALALSVKRAGLHVIFVGSFTALLIAALAEGRANRRALGAAASLLALSTMSRAMVEIDPESFHLWMGLSAAAFLLATALAAALGMSLRRSQSV